MMKGSRIYMPNDFPRLRIVQEGEAKPSYDSYC
jgi:hypothetical protein